MCCLIVSRESLRRQINDLGCNRVRFPKRVCLTWEFLNGDRWTQLKTPCEQAITQPQPQPNEIVVLLKKKLKSDALQPQIVQMIKAGKSCEAVATALSISTEAVSNALTMHRAARRPPARIDDKSRHKPTVPFVAKYARNSPGALVLGRSPMATPTGPRRN